MQYDDFAIELDRGPDGAYRAWVRSPAGEASGPVKIALGTEDLAPLYVSLARCVRGGETPTNSLEADLRAIGRRLFQGLFSTPILQCLHYSLGEIGPDGSRGLRIKLQARLEDPEVAKLHGLPWELLFREETNEFLVLSRRFTVVRSVSLPKEARHYPPPQVLRILVLASAPRGLPALALTTELERLTQALEMRADVEVKTLPRADLGYLREALLREEHHVLHFIGHGMLEEANGEGNLLLEAEDGYPLAVSGDLLAQHLRDFPSLRLVFLNACQTAQTAVSNPFAGVATALLQAGIPAVLAMQFPMTDQAAIVLSERVYQRLAQGDTIDAAVAEGRLAIRRQDPRSPEWGTPVLFLRTAGPLVQQATVDATSNLSPLQPRAWISAALLTAALSLAVWISLGAPGLRFQASRPPQKLSTELTSPITTTSLPPVPTRPVTAPDTAPKTKGSTSPEDLSHDGPEEPMRERKPESPIETPITGEQQKPSAQPTSKVHRLAAGQPVFLAEIETDAVADFLSLQGEDLVRLTLVPREGKSIIRPIIGPTREPIEFDADGGRAIVHVLTIDWGRQTLHLRTQRQR